MIMGCQEVYALRRAQEWTAALTRWCEEQPEMVAFSGRCLVHRAEIMELHGVAGGTGRGAAGSPALLAGEESVGRRPAFTKRRSTACRDGSRRPRRRIGMRAGAGANRSRVWPCCG